MERSDPIRTISGGGSQKDNPPVPGWAGPVPGPSRLGRQGDDSEVKQADGAIGKGSRP